MPLDKDIEQFNTHYASMPWMSLNFGDEKIKDLKTRYLIQEVPSIIVLDNDSCKAISIRGRKEVQDQGFSAFKMWKDRLSRQQFSFDTPFHPISKTITEEAKVGQEVYDKFKADEKERKQKAYEEALEQKRLIE